MSNNGIFTGDLTHDSPQLLRELTRHFNPEAKEQIIKSYYNCWKSGGCNDSPVQREDGVSYNPRPARIASLLLTEEKIYDEAVIAAAILSCIPSDSKNEVKAIALAHDLDLARHLHMTTFSIAEQKSSIATVERNLKKYSGLQSRLHELASATCKRQSQRLNNL